MAYRQAHIFGGEETVRETEQSKYIHGEYLIQQRITDRKGHTVGYKQIAKLVRCCDCYHCVYSDHYECLALGIEVKPDFFCAGCEDVERKILEDE